MQATPVHTGDVPALRKGLAVLELLASDGPLTLAEIQRRGALNKTMTFRLIRVLRETGYVRHDLESHRYSLALKLFNLGGAVAARLDIVRVGLSILDRLRGEFGETINLGVIAEGHVVYVAMAESSRPGLRMASRVGGHGCLHSTSIGKAILAFLPEPDREALLANLAWTAVTPKTITSLHDLRDSWSGPDFAATRSTTRRTRSAPAAWACRFSTAPACRSPRSASPVQWRASTTTPSVRCPNASGRRVGRFRLVSATTS